MFQKLGLNLTQEMSSKNVATVIVTAKLPPFARIGQKIDVTVSSIGNASSLAGGTLLITPLKGETVKYMPLPMALFLLEVLKKERNSPLLGKYREVE